MIRFGLVCLWHSSEISGYRAMTASQFEKLDSSRYEVLWNRISENADILFQSITRLADHQITSLRVTSGLLPLSTHLKWGYIPQEIPEQIIDRFKQCGDLARERGVRLSFHPGQYNQLASPTTTSVRRNTLMDLDTHAILAEWLGIDVINIHGGGTYGVKDATKRDLISAIHDLPDAIRSRLTLENDEKSWDVRSLVDVSVETDVPIVFDVHHHRCYRDPLPISEATELAFTTWGDREPLFHISSPRDGWGSSNPCAHADYIDPDDFPIEWLYPSRPFTLDVEAKHKEFAVRRLRDSYNGKLSTF